jgi:hypothetical protein
MNYLGLTTRRLQLNRRSDQNPLHPGARRLLLRNRLIVRFRDCRLANPYLRMFLAYVAVGALICAGNRPVFCQTQPPATVPDAACGVPPFELVGTVFSPKVRFALITRHSIKTDRVVSEGDQSDGWAFEQILSDRAIIRQLREGIECKVRLPLLSRIHTLSPAEAAAIERRIPGHHIAE